MYVEYITMLEEAKVVIRFQEFNTKQYPNTEYRNKLTLHGWSAV